MSAQSLLLLTILAAPTPARPVGPMLTGLRFDLGAVAAPAPVAMAPRFGARRYLSNEIELPEAGHATPSTRLRLHGRKVKLSVPLR